MKTLALSPKTTVAVLALLAFGGTFSAVHAIRSRGDEGTATDPNAIHGTAAPGRGVGTNAARLGRAREPGLRHDYAVRFDQELALGAPREGGGARQDTTVALRVSATLSTAFVAHVDGKHRLFAELGSVQLTLGAGGRDDKTAALEAELRKPFYVLADPDGRVRGYAFVRGSSVTAQNIVRGLLGSAQIAARDEATFSAAEDDIHGSYEATYRREGGEVVKTKGRYQRVATMTSLVRPDQSAQVDTRGQSRAAVGDDGWPTRVVVDEHQRASLGEGLPSATTKIRLELTLGGTRSDLSLLGRYEREVADLVAVGPFGTGDEGEANRAADVRTVGDRSLDELMRRASASSDEEQRGALGVQLTARFRLTPSDADRAAELVKTLSPREGQLVVGSLGGAETPAAVRALGNIVNAREVPVEVRAQATTQLAFAGPHGALAKEPLLQAMRDDSLDVRRGAALALGNVARELGGDGDVESELVQRYRSASSDEERADLLRALGNSGSPALVPLATEASSSASEPLREAAAHALRFLPVGEADRMLSSIVAQDPSEGVRESAVDAMGFRVVEMFAGLLDRTVQLDPSARVRREVVTTVNRALAGRGETLRPEARAQLLAIVQKAPPLDQESPLP